LRGLLPPLLLLLSACAAQEAPPADAAPARTELYTPGPIRCDAPAAEATPQPGQARLYKAMWTPPPPMPPGPPDAPDYLRTPEPELRSTGDPRVDAYIQRVLREGWGGWRPYLVRALAGVRANQAVLDAIPDKPSTAGDYVSLYVTPERVARGQQLYRELSGMPLFEGEQKAPLEVLLALWGAHSGYGAQPPRFDVIEALVNLGACGKGPDWGSFSIYHAVAALAEGRVERSAARAYADGRLGQARLFPEQYRDWGRDGDGDGRIDIWGNRADILANIQRRWLQDWDASQPLIVEIEPVAYNPAIPNEVRRVRASLGWMAAHRRADGKPWPEDMERFFGWQPIQPSGPQGPTFLASSNLRLLGLQSPFLGYYWNQPDQEFAIAIAILAERIAGRPGPKRPLR
jgi:membrane-bound lytic murein transglycosylase B